MSEIALNADERALLVQFKQLAPQQQELVRSFIVSFNTLEAKNQKQFCHILRKASQIISKIAKKKKVGR